jgi:hypothetical protein
MSPRVEVLSKLLKLKQNSPNSIVCIFFAKLTIFAQSRLFQAKDQSLPARDSPTKEKASERRCRSADCCTCGEGLPSSWL